MSKRVKKAVIPAAGLGTRLLPATKTIPKEMLPIVSKPSIQYIVEEAVAAGIEDILIVTGRMKTSMEDYFDYTPALESRLRREGKSETADMLRRTADLASVHYIRQKEPKGLGHAIWCARRFIGNEPFAVLLGDDIMKSEVPVTAQLIAAEREYGGSVVGVKQVAAEQIGKYCSLDVEPMTGNLMRVRSLIEKPRPEQVMSLYAILGRYVLQPEIFDVLENLPAGYGGEIQLTDGINALCGTSGVLACDFKGRRYDTGNIYGYLETVIDFALEDEETSDWLKAFLKQKPAQF